MDNGWDSDPSPLGGWHNVPVFDSDADWGEHKPTGFKLPERVPSIDYIPENSKCAAST